MTQSSSAFDEGWSSLNKWVKGRRQADGKSSMWQGLIRDFAVHGDAPPTDLRAFAFRPNAFRAYNFAEEGPMSVRLRLALALGSLSYLAVRGLNLLRARLWQRNIDGFGVPLAGVHPASRRELRRQGLEAGFLEFCHTHRMYAGNFNAMKAYYVAAQVDEFLRSSPAARVLEVGGGMGTLAAVVLHRHDIATYTIVDLPEMLLNSAITIRALFPERNCVFIHPGHEEIPQAHGSVYFCVPESAHLLANASSDLAFNIDSFQEMTAEQVAGYIALVQRVVRPGGRFLNINRRKQLTAENYDNNPLMYPYGSGNRVLRWEVDRFLARTFNLTGTRIDPWMLRYEEIASV